MDSLLSSLVGQSMKPLFVFVIRFLSLKRLGIKEAAPFPLYVRV